MKKLLILYSTSVVVLILSFIQSLIVNAQTLDLDPKGVIVPRITSTQRDALTPTIGQLIFNTDINCFNVFTNNTWQNLCGMDDVQAPIAWIQKADFGGIGRYGAFAFTVGNKAYVGGGAYELGGDAADVFEKDFWEYDPSLNIWTQKADFAFTTQSGRAGVLFATGFAIGNRGYVGLGVHVGIVPDRPDYDFSFFEYNPTDNQWVKKSSYGIAYPDEFSGISFATRRGRAYAIGFSIGNKGYMGLGYLLDRQSGVINVAYFKGIREYDPLTDSWTRKANFPGVGLKNAFVFTVGNKAYVGTGESENPADSSRITTNQFWEFNPIVNTWTQKADFGGGIRTNAIAFSIGNKGFVGSGNSSLNKDNEIYLSDFWEYDVATDMWQQKKNLPSPRRSEAIGFALNGKGYLGLGLGKTNNTSNSIVILNDFWQYEPDKENPVQLTVTQQSNAFNGSNQLLKLDTFGDVNISGKIPIENFTAPSLLNGWVNYDNTFSNAGFQKDNENLVNLKGLIKNGNASSNTILFTLPVAYRPAERLVFITPSSAFLGRVDILPSGDVMLINGTNTFIGLDGISFRADGN
jgi:N-acetylneuraminic acid mutarotase